MTKAIFLDRDGTLIVDKHYLSDPSQVELIPGAKEFIQAAKKLNYKLYLFSNQSGVGRAYFTLETVHACNARMLQLLDLSDFHATCIPTETPDQPQVYRKPSPKFILERIHSDHLNPKNCWMVGDKLVDLETAINANINPIWVSTGKPSDSHLSTFLKQHNIPILHSLSDLLQYIH